MSSESLPQPHDLPNKPLVEALFELRWSLSKEPDGSQVDPGFRILLGRMFDQLREDYPTVVDLPPHQIPESMVPYVMRTQFRKGKDEWPLMQIGPGIMSINETTAYQWETFRPCLLRGLDALYSAYPTEIAAIEPKRVSLRYINAIPLEPEVDESPLLDFLRDSMHTDIAVAPELFDAPLDARTPLGLRLALAYRLVSPEGIGHLVFSTGENDGKSAIILEINIESREAQVPGRIEEFADWLDAAHDVVDKWFFQLVQGKLLSQFGGTNE